MSYVVTHFGYGTERDGDSVCSCGLEQRQDYMRSWATAHELYHARVELKRWHHIEAVVGGTYGEDYVKALGDLILNDPVVSGLVTIGGRLEREDIRHSRPNEGEHG